MFDNFNKSSTLFDNIDYLNMDKCSFAMNNIKYFGYVIDSVGIHVDPNKVQILKDWPIPQ